MKTVYPIAILLLMGLSTGCSARTGYDMMRLHQDQRCLDLQGTDRDQCMRQNEMSYDDYQNRLKERDQEKAR